MRRLWKFFMSLREISCTKLTIIIMLLPLVSLITIFLFLIIIGDEETGSIVANSRPCAKVGKQILGQQGSAVDAAIATLLCEGVASPNNAGIGGGFVALMYIQGKFDTLIATPTTPIALSENPDALFKLLHSTTNSTQAKFTAVPGELMGLWEMHKKYGFLPWRVLFEPTIILCEEGVPVTRWYINALRNIAIDEQSSDSIRQLLYKLDDSSDETMKIAYPTLAKTLRRIANEGADVFYDGPIGQLFIDDILEAGGFLTMSDLRNYAVKWDDKPIRIKLWNNYRAYTTPLPTVGIMVAFVLNILQSYRKVSKPVYWHVVVEAMKHAFGHRLDLGDPDHENVYDELIRRTYNKMKNTHYARFIRDKIKLDRTFDNPAYYGARFNARFESGSSSVCVSSPTGDVVVVTSSLARHTTTNFISRQTGITANGHLRNFVKATKKEMPLSPANILRAGKRPLVSASPIIVLKAERARLHFVAAASGGPKSTTLIISAVINYIFYKKSANQVVNGPHLHHQLFPNVVEYDDDRIDTEIVNYLKKVGHDVRYKRQEFEIDDSVLCIGHEHYRPELAYDSRTEGSKALFRISPPNYFVSMLLALLNISVLLMLVVTIVKPLAISSIMVESSDSSLTSDESTADLSVTPRRQVTI